MKIGIVGTGPRAIAIGRLLKSGGHDVSFSDARGQVAADRAAAETGSHAEIPYKQAMTRDMLVLACARRDVDAALTAIGSRTDADVVDALDGGPEQPRQGAELIARKLDSHRVVRALIVLPQGGANIPICGDDEQAKALVREAFEACGCLITDRGPLANAVELEPLSVIRGEVATGQRVFERQPAYL